MLGLQFIKSRKKAATTKLYERDFYYGADVESGDFALGFFLQILNTVQQLKRKHGKLEILQLVHRIAEYF